MGNAATNLPGTKVQRKVGGPAGAIVPDSFNLCGAGQAMINWDGSQNAEAVDLGTINVLGPIAPKADPQKCNGCVFGYFNGGRKYCCCRYEATRRWVALYGDGKDDRAGNRLPDRIYPYCQSPRAASY